MRKSHINFISLKSKKEIREVFTNGFAFRMQGFKLIVKKNDSSCFKTLIIPSHGYGNAVNRNLLKRRVRCIFNKLLGSSVSFSDIILIVYKNESEVSFESLYNKIKTLFIRSKIIE